MNANLTPSNLPMEFSVTHHGEAAALAASGVSKRFGTTQALDNVALTVERGQVCALLGRNGAGKTTFIHCALGLTAPSSGSLRVLGAAAGSLAARQSIGVMLQDTDLPERLSAREHLSLYAQYFPRPQDVGTLIEQAGIGGFAERRYRTLSGGQKRRVQFAIALVGRPRLLFLDEPTSGLDKEARRAVWDNVRRLAASGTTVILTTHYLEEADALADRIVVINRGRIIADGAADAIRGQVGGALISCQTRAVPGQIRALKAVRAVSQHGRLVTIISDDAAQTLAALLAIDPALRDLCVRKPGLDEAFTLLTDNDRELH
jgi:ABC-2 type transport system ATP-binding protein